MPTMLRMRGAELLAAAALFTVVSSFAKADPIQWELIPDGHHFIDESGSEPQVRALGYGENTGVFFAFDESRATMDGLYGHWWWHELTAPSTLLHLITVPTDPYDVEFIPDHEIDLILGARPGDIPYLAFSVQTNFTAPGTTGAITDAEGNPMDIPTHMPGDYYYRGFLYPNGETAFVFHVPEPTSLWLLGGAGLLLLRRRRKPGGTRPANHTTRSLIVLLAILVFAVPAGAATIVEVDYTENALPVTAPLDKQIVPTTTPLIRITRDPADLPGSFAVLLTREDGRAGLGGTGIDLSGSFLEVSPNVFEAIMPVLVGENTIRLQDGGGTDVVAATMLNYSLDFEDTNGNAALDPDEDLNGDGFLSPGEDTNANEFLDWDEDFNGNVQLDTTEDTNNNSTLEEDEDLNFNNVLDSDVALPVSAVADPAVVSVHPQGYDQQATTVLLDFDPSASTLDVGAFFRSLYASHGFDVVPSGILVDDMTGDVSFTVTARITDGTAPDEVARLLNGQSIGDYDFPPAVPPAFPLLVAQVNALLAAPATVTGELMPARLRNGAAPNAGEGHESANNNGGFDNDGDNPDELDASWHHFFTQTYQAQALMTALPFRATPRAVCVIDTGFGNGSAALPDIPAGRIVAPRDHRVAAAGGAASANLSGVRDGLFATAMSHGTYCAELAAGDGTQFVLGTGRRSALRPIRTSFTLASLNNALNTAGLNLRTSVVSCSWRMAQVAPNAATGRAWVAANRNGLRAGLQRCWGRGKITVVCSGNLAQNTELDYPAVFTVPNRSGAAINDDMDAMTDEGPFRTDPPENPRAIGVGATGLVNSPRGPEQYASFASTGTRITMCAPGQGVRSLQANFGPASYAFSPPISGCSFATPQVAGAITELINVAEGINAGLWSTGRGNLNQLVADTVIATADDLGSTTGAGNRPNNDAGNGGTGDNLFGFGRLNYWKATLAVANRGISAQFGRTAGGGGNDSVFTRLPLINDANTRWYGFEIIVPHRNATVWIDGTQLSDGNATMPNSPNITAFKGMRSDLSVVRGVHTLSDGSAMDPAAGGRPGRVVEEEPLIGIVPLGTRLANGRGQYVLHFSVQRSDLYDGDGMPRTLSLRRAGQNTFDTPFFNMRLDTAEMRTGRVSGVVYDDYVFQITPSDYGDAPIPPTVMAAENGARHQNFNFEWLGNPNGAIERSVTHEQNVETENSGGSADVDVDGVTNRKGFHDRDGRDDGVTFFPLTFKPGNTGKVEFTINVQDAMSPRYAAAADRSLYFNLWIDWNANGMWDAGNSEHCLNGVQINPSGWAVVSSGSAGTVTRTASGPNWATFRCTSLPVGNVGCGNIWARARLDYGENVGRNNPLPRFPSLPSMRNPAGGGMPGLAGAACRYGEVEDYFIGSDFGDAPDDGMNRYPTLKMPNGARHLDIHQEWLGPDNDMRPNVSREIDANDRNENCSSNSGTDEDKIENLRPYDTDGMDDGVTMPPFLPCDDINIDIEVTSSISARGAGLIVPVSTSVGYQEDPGDDLPRYNLTIGTRRLYLSGWADWNCNKVFEPGEKIVDDVIDPATFGEDGEYTLGEPFDDNNENGVRDAGEAYVDFFGVDSKTFTYTVTVPCDACPYPWTRFRLAFGEDEDDAAIPISFADEDGRDNDQAQGGALFGEVEDYPIWLSTPWYYPIYGNVDVDGSSDVDIYDLAAMLPAFNAPFPHPNYLVDADFNLDGVVDLWDLVYASNVVRDAYAMFPLDADRNNEITISDYASFATCITGPNGSTSDVACEGTFDTDLDGDIDLADYMALQEFTE